MSRDARLPGAMREEAARMEKRADDLREYAGQLDAKAADLKRRASLLDSTDRNDTCRPSTAPTEKTRRAAASGLAKGQGPREGGGRSSEGRPPWSG